MTFFSGKRSYPWRYFVITNDDRKLIENTLSYRLAEKNVKVATCFEVHVGAVGCGSVPPFPAG